MDKQYYIDGILKGDRVILGQAITLTESTLEKDQLIAEDVLEHCLARSGNSVRIAVSGSPGVGKSTFIEKLGTEFIAKGEKVAVLAIDPSSQSSGGSILGDKTRMEELSTSENAFIRPSPASEHLGGVAGKTRETIILCEAAGYQKMIVETVGVGQSEIAAAVMTDIFILLVLAGAGDELQGIKRGIMELADLVVVNKSDGDNIDNSKRSRQNYLNALHLFPQRPSKEQVDVFAVSSINGNGFDELIDKLNSYYSKIEKSGYLATKRNEQQLSWLNDAIKMEIQKKYSAVEKDQVQEFLKQVTEGKIHPAKAARILIENI